MFFGVPQGLILDPIVFNILLSDLFLVIKNFNFACCAHDNAIYQSDNNVNDVIIGLQLPAEKKITRLMITN